MASGAGAGAKPGAVKPAAARSGKAAAAPAMPVAHAVAIGAIVGEIRRTLRIRQRDLAVRAGVSRQWIVAMEQGKPSLEVGLVLRTLEALGLAVELRPVDPPPAWIVRATQDAERARAETQRRRHARRRTRRDAERLRRQTANLPKVEVELE